MCRRLLHSKRRFSLTDVDCVAELAEKLSQRTWTLCTGFRFRSARGDLLFLNDSTSEDGAQEYAVIRGAYQIESITFGWCSVERSVQLIREMLAGPLGCRVRMSPLIDPDPRHVCDLCR